MPKLALKNRAAKEPTQPEEEVGDEDVVAALAAYPDPREEFWQLREGLHLDRNTLDEDMIRQPVLFNEVSEAHALSASERDAAKEALAGVDAQVAHDMRLHAQLKGDKINETMVGDAVQRDIRHIESYANWQHLARRAAYLAALKESFTQRGKMLRELGSLYVVGYFDRSVSSASLRDVQAAKAAAGKEGMRRLREDLVKKHKEEDND